MLWVVAGLATVSIVGAFAIRMMHRSGSAPTATAPAPASPPQAKPAADAQSTRLDLRAGACGVRLGTNPVTFAPTAIPADIRADSKTVCAMAREAVDRQNQSTRKSLDELCATVGPKLLDSLGVDGFQQAAERMRETGADQDSSTSQLYAIVTRCIDPAAAVTAVASSLGMRIYSVGHARAGTTNCLGYLQEMTGKSAGGSVGYDLFGTGPCTDQDFSAADTFHPERNPSGRKPGDVIRADFAYTGPLPPQWTYKGQKYAFASDAAVPSAAAPAPNAAASGHAETSTQAPVTTPTPAPAEARANLASLSVGQLEDLVENGSAPAWTELGVRYLNGSAGVQKDQGRAVFWFQKAAERGVPRAQTNLGWLYVTGKGVERNDAAAIDLFKKAAAQGYPNAEDSLGWMYENGRGVERDKDVAMGWYRKAAEKGFAKSQENLARLEADHG